MLPDAAAEQALAPAGERLSWWRVALWWTATVLTLVVLDDLTFGPVFWIISRTAGPWISALTALVLYTAAQVYIVFRATEDHPGRIAAFFLRRLDLNRRSRRVAANEHKLRSQVAGWTSAIVMTPIIGGVLPPLLLWRAGWPRRQVRQIVLVCAPIYALEFAILHGLLPALA